MRRGELSRSEGGSLVLHRAWMPDETFHNRTLGNGTLSLHTRYVIKTLVAPNPFKVKFQLTEANSGAKEFVKRV